MLEVEPKESPSRSRRRASLWFAAGTIVAFVMSVVIPLFFVDVRPGWASRRGRIDPVGRTFSACMGTVSNARLNGAFDGGGRFEVPIEADEIGRDFGEVVTVLVHPQGPKHGAALSRPLGDWYYRTYLRLIGKGNRIR